MAHAMSFPSPSSFACSCAPVKYCGLPNELLPARHDMALQVLLRCAQLLLNSICHAVKSYFTVLFLNLLRHHGFLQSWYLLYLFATHCPFSLLMGILYLTWSTRCCFTWILAIFVWVSLSLSYSLVIKSTGVFAREAWQGRSRDFVLQPKNTCNLHHLSEVTWVGWMLIFGTQEDLFLSSWDVTSAVSHCVYTNCMLLPRNGDKQGCTLKNECLFGKPRFYWWLFYCSFL